MAQPGGQPRWTHDPTRNLYFYHDQHTDELVYQDGNRLPAPRRSLSATPRTGGGSSGAQPLPYSQNGSGSYPQDAHSVDVARRQQHPTQATLDAQPTHGLHGPTINVSTARPSSRTFDRGGVQMVVAEDPQTRVRTTFGTSPASRITDPQLYNAGVRATRMLYGTGEGEAEHLYSNYRMRQRDFFCFGRVFLLLWVEPAGESGTLITSVEPSDQAFSNGAFNERVYSKVRRFVVVREGQSYCSALPIATYGGRGVSKPGVKKSEHAIIHSGRDAPQPKTHERPQRGEDSIRPIPIRVVPDNREEALEPMSRLDFGKVHTIQHNIKVRPFGMVHPDSKTALYEQFQNVWSNTATIVPASEDQSSQASASSSSGRKARAPPSTADGSLKGRSGNTTVVEERDESEEDDDDEEEDESDEEEAAISPRSDYGRASSSLPRQFQSGYVPSATQAQQRTVASSSGTSQSESSARMQWARDCATRLVHQGYSREQAFQWLVSQIQKQGRSQQAADAEVRALLSGKAPHPPSPQSGSLGREHTSSFLRTAPRTQHPDIDSSTSSLGDQSLEPPGLSERIQNHRHETTRSPRAEPVDHEKNSEYQSKGDTHGTQLELDEGQFKSDIHRVQLELQRPPSSLETGLDSTTLAQKVETKSIHAVQTDSGYASMDRQNKNPAQSGKDDESDRGTAYSGESAIPLVGNARTRSIEAFAIEIIDRLSGNPWVPSHQREDVERLLRDSLKVYTQDVREQGPDEKVVNGARFISQQRPRIASLIVVGRSGTRISDSDGRGPSQSAYSLRENMNKWLSQASTDVDPNTIPPVEPGDVSNLGEDENLERFIDESRPSLIGHPAFESLLTDVRAILQPFLAPGLGNITQCLKDAIDESATQADFRLQWDPVAFWKMNYPETHDIDIMNVLVVIHASEGRHQALTCAEYLKQTWPQSCATTVPLFRSLVRILAAQGRAVQSVDGITIEATTTSGQLHLNVFAKASDLIRIGEQLAWLGAACRATDTPSDPIYSQAVIGSVHDDTHTTPMFDIRYEDKVRSQFDVPTRDESQPGLEIPFDIMASLGETDEVAMFDGRLLLKGHSTLFVAVKKVDRSVIWHFEKLDDADANPYDAALSIETDEKLDLTCITDCRHFVGWTEEVSVNFATKDAHYDISPTSIGLEGSSLAFTSFSISASKYLGISANFIRGKREALFLSGPSTYKLKMDNLQREFMMIYDDQTQKVWLLKADRVLLHLLRCRISTRHHDSQHFVLDDFNYASESPEENVASILKDEAFVSRKLDEEVSTPYVESELIDGVLKVKEVRRFTPYTVRDEILDLYGTFQKIVAMQGKISSDPKINIPSSPKPVLQGWSFDNVAQGLDRLMPRALNVESHAQAWMSLRDILLTPVLFGGGFGEILRPARPTQLCPGWTVMPGGSDYMAASTHSLRQIFRDHGAHRGGHVQLALGLSWHQSQLPFGACSCAVQKRSRRCDRLQDLYDRSVLSKAKSPSRDIFDTFPMAAFIFGRTSGLKRFLPSKVSFDSSAGANSDSAVGASLSSSDQSDESQVQPQELAPVAA
ncbi:hypothetical protein M409DRAFT_29827 [Zasmidium cellare ATCC 36951]|uniref:DUF6590 domain-containing protein n=1 Tax=Zasmidium cellare ATCC 36951 TaxID=1080233 RepID=A0A6A6C0H4_ZASCE|nr:uncharacterized protein M409DRAFT_29827 [Zasmidium cellare ATCC 36951]KAF2159660.1 hypothetical protein M409DRAFT_29827 [Zasmidium cellare ATCC 36951]